MSDDHIQDQIARDQYAMTDDWEVLYRRLRDRDPEIFRRAIQYSEGITIQHRLNVKAAADLERSLVVFALELTGGLKA